MFTYIVNSIIYHPDDHTLRTSIIYFNLNLFFSASYKTLYVN